MIGELKINLAALAANYRFLKSITVATCEVGAAVKANAYGLGAEMVARTLFEQGARSFFVAHLSEGIELRSVLPNADIFILHGFAQDHAKEYKAHRLITVLNSFEELQAFQAYGGGACALHFDTGMNRLGFRDIPKDLSYLDIKLVMSHFASSEERVNLYNALQGAKFADIAKKFLSARKSLANSSGIFLSDEYHYDLVRPGIALYGGNPTPDQINPMKAVVQLNVPILQINVVKKGETAGYNQTCVFQKDTKVATVALGYADGFLRSLSNKGKFYWKDYELPICGRISMDLTICDLSAVPENELPVRGDMLEVIGSHQDVDSLAYDAGTNCYEILTRLPSRHLRVYQACGQQD